MFDFDVVTGPTQPPRPHKDASDEPAIGEAGGASPAPETGGEEG